MITIRYPESIYQISGKIQNGTFHGRWHFSFGEYHDSSYIRFGTLRVFNDDTLSPGAIWPLHPHQNIEVVTYCAGGEFRHADERGLGGVLKKGWIQHTTVGSGMWHSEINNREDIAMRFIQMWFVPSENNLKPSVKQRAINKEGRTNQLLPLVSPVHQEALFIASDARVYSSFLQAGKGVEHSPGKNRGMYLYVLEGGPVQMNNDTVPVLGAAMVQDETGLTITAEKDAELLLVDTLLS